MPTTAPRLFFNDINPFTQLWVKNLWPAARTLTKDIRELTPNDAAGYRRCHFFAGIGGWELALAMAGWPENVTVWTGSCPCQPFSEAGLKRRDEDERDLWPHLYRLVRECQPPVVFGEQVANPLGLEWIDRVQADLEEGGYAVGKAVIPAASVGAPHDRKRVWWVGYSTRTRLERLRPIHRRVAPSWDSWSDGISIIDCTDGKRRRTQSGVRPLAHGIPRRMDQIIAYGNAIVPQVAGVFIRSFMEVIWPDLCYNSRSVFTGRLKGSLS